jgi:8-oxo-dGTP diphosphatase
MMQVTAAVIERDGRILVARREILEELGLEIEVGDSLGEYPYASPERALTLLAFRASVRSGVPVLNDHSEIHWALPGELERFTFAEPDRPLVSRIMTEAPCG